MREFTVADIPGVPADFLTEGYYYQNSILYRKQTDLKKEVNAGWPVGPSGRSRTIGSTRP